MKIKRMKAVARKEFIHLMRDPRSLAIGIALPMMMLFLFGFALTLDVDRVPILVWDQDGTPQSREFISRFEASRYFTVEGYASGYPELEHAIDTRRALAALIVPVEFAQKVESGQTAGVQWIVDGSDSNTAQIATGYAEAVTAAFSRNALIRRLERAGITPPAITVDLRQRVWFNADLESRNYIIPGLIAVIMMVIAGLLTSLSVAREWDTGTMEQLISTPIQVPELILGKLTPYFCIALLDVGLAVLMGEFLFHVPLRGNVALLFLLASVFLVGALALGMMISIVTKTQLLASQLAMIATFLPTFLLSGFAFDIANMPRVLQAISYLIPARYFIVIVKGIYLKGIGMEILLPEAALLVVFGVLVLLLAHIKFKKKMV